MSFTPQGQLVQPSARDAQSQPAALQPAQTKPERHGNDNREQAGAVDDLTRSKEQTWETFARWLIIGGLLWMSRPKGDKGA